MAVGRSRDPTQEMKATVFGSVWSDGRTILPSVGPDALISRSNWRPEITSGSSPPPYSPAALWSQTSNPVAATMAPNFSVRISSSSVVVHRAGGAQFLAHAALALQKIRQCSRSMTGTFGTACGKGT